MASSLKIASVLLLFILVAEQALTAHGSVSCGSVASAMRPCIGYLKRGGPVRAPCCGGVRSLLSSARTTRDRQTACRCLKSAAGYIRGIKLSAAAALPRACRVHIPYSISPRTNCANVR